MRFIPQSAISKPVLYWKSTNVMGNINAEHLAETSSQSLASFAERLTSALMPVTLIT